MAETTTKLIDDCKDVQSRLEDAVKGSTSSMNNLENTVGDVERLKDDVDHKVASKLQESAISSRTFAKGSLDRLELALEKAKEPIKALESKIKVKGVLDYFKTQKSLADAKDALANTKQARDTAASQYKEFQKSFTKLSERVDTQSDRTTIIFFAGPILDDLAAFTKKEVPLALKKQTEISKEVDLFRLGLEAFEVELKSQAPWTKIKHEKCSLGVKKLLSQLEGKKNEINKVANEVTLALMPGRWKDYSKVEKTSTVKSALVEARKVQRGLLREIDVVSELIQDYQTRCAGLEFDLKFVETSDGPQRDEQANEKLRQQAVDRMEHYCDVVKHGVDDFPGEVKELKSNAETMKKFIVSPTTVPESEWDKLEEEKDNLRLKSRQSAQLFGAIKRAFLYAQKLQKQFAKDKEIKEMFDKAQKVFVEKGKNYKTFQDAIPPMLEFIDKVLQKRPK